MQFFRHTLGGFKNGMEIVVLNQFRSAEPQHNFVNLPLNHSLVMVLEHVGDLAGALSRARKSVGLLVAGVRNLPITPTIRFEFPLVESLAEQLEARL